VNQNSIRVQFTSSFQTYYEEILINIREAYSRRM